MADFISGETVITSSADSSASHSIPVNTDLIACAISGYSSGNANLVDELNYDGDTDLEFTTLGRAYFSGSDAQLHTLYMTSADDGWPGTGAATLDWGATGAYSEGFIIKVDYFQDVDTASPIVDTVEVDEGEFSSPQTSSLTGVGTDDIGYVAAWSYGGAADVDPATYNQNATTETGPFNDAYLGVAYEKGESALRVESSATHTACVFAAFNHDAGGTFTPKNPLCKPLYGPLRGPIC